MPIIAYVLFRFIYLDKNPTTVISFLLYQTNVLLAEGNFTDFKSPLDAPGYSPYFLKVWMVVHFRQLPSHVGAPNTFDLPD